MDSIKKELMPGVRLTYLPSRKFKTGLVSAGFLVPLARETAGLNSLLPAVLRRGSERYPDMKRISEELDLLYGARLDYAVRRKSERMCVGFLASFIDDAYTPGGERLLESVTALMGELLLHPLLSGGAFRTDYVEQEKENLLDAIRSRINDKREWADFRLLQELCGNEPYGVSRVGDEETVQAITPERLYEYYCELIRTAPLELIYCGAAPLERVEAALMKVFSALPRGVILTLPEVLPHTPRTEVHRVTEYMDVTQGKLGMGFSCPTEDVPAMILANVLFGGSSNSKLFMNVREKLSLCYYASSGYHRSKGFITVSSGVEFCDFQRAYDEILLQLASVQRGELEDWELAGARSTIRNSFRTLADSQGRLEDFTLGEIACGTEQTVDELLRRQEEVTLERVLAAAGTVQLDTVYFLTGKEERP